MEQQIKELKEELLTRDDEIENLTTQITQLNEELVELQSDQKNTGQFIDASGRTRSMTLTSPNAAGGLVDAHDDML